MNLYKAKLDLKYFEFHLKVMKSNLQALMGIITEVKKETKTGLQANDLFSYLPDTIVNHENNLDENRYK